ncbi:O-antigen ligase family protein [Otariodibacter oris]|uniref:Uncharacterized protein n=1 Tax=Otariodibacter oris TaxID=1032623 RepID=A0A420XER3_9PAST|nr:O-antigen ligase family protein [Otariodibacter oris]QGM81373.1 hypothetical protein A6A10_08090 [Otariodibacter oris]RKR70815.1 hypothetical protein DES31_1825 [Otariodibacter oris]
MIEKDVKKYKNINIYLNNMMNFIKFISNYYLNKRENNLYVFDLNKGKSMIFSDFIENNSGINSKKHEKLKDFLTYKINDKSIEDRVFFRLKSLGDFSYPLKIKNSYINSIMFEECIGILNEIYNSSIENDVVDENDFFIRKVDLEKNQNIDEFLVNVKNLNDAIYISLSNFIFEKNAKNFTINFTKIISYFVFFCSVLLFLLAISYLERSGSSFLLYDLSFSNGFNYFIFFISVFIIIVSSFFYVYLILHSFKNNKYIVFSLLIFSLILVCVLLRSIIPILGFLIVSLIFGLSFIYFLLHNKDYFYIFFVIVFIICFFMYFMLFNNFLGVKNKINISPFISVENLSMELIGMRDKNSSLYWINQDYLNMRGYDFKINNIYTVNNLEKTYKTIKGKIIFRTSESVLFLPEEQQDESQAFVIPKQDIYK